MTGRLEILVEHEWLPLVPYHPSELGALEQVLALNYAAVEHPRFGRIYVQPRAYPLRFMREADV